MFGGYGERRGKPKTDLGDRILSRVMGSRGFSPLLCYKEIPLYMKKIVFGG